MASSLDSRNLARLFLLAFCEMSDFGSRDLPKNRSIEFFLTRLIYISPSFKSPTALSSYLSSSFTYHRLLIAAYSQPHVSCLVSLACLLPRVSCLLSHSDHSYLLPLPPLSLISLTIEALGIQYLHHSPVIDDFLNLPSFAIIKPLFSCHRQPYLCHHRPHIHISRRQGPASYYLFVTISLITPPPAIERIFLAYLPHIYLVPPRACLPSFTIIKPAPFMKPLLYLEHQQEPPSQLSSLASLP